MDGRITWMTDRAVDQLRATGRLVSTGSGHVIPQHVAHTPSELAALLAEYKSLAKILNSRCVLRGQNRDYFNDDGSLSVLPSSFRTQKLRDEFEWRNRQSSHLDAMLRPWEAVLRSFSVDCNSMDRKEWNLESGGH